MSKTVLITRARGDEVELTDALHECGLNVIHEPLTDILLIHTARTELEQALSTNPNAILLTSRHGVRALAALSPMRDIPLLCVGESTRQAAESLGFDRCTATGHEAGDMIEYILSAYDEDARFAYPSAEHIRTDITDVLAQHGMVTERVIVYEAKAVERLSDTLTAHIRQGHIDAVTFLSGRAAAIFMDHAKKADIAKQLKKVTACCMSRAIAEKLDKKEWKSLRFADEATLASLALCVDNALR